MNWAAWCNLAVLPAQLWSLRDARRAKRNWQRVREPRISFLINDRVMFGPMTPTQLEELRHWCGEDVPAIGWFGTDLLDLRIER